jgi:uncharacterized protein
VARSGYADRLARLRARLHELESVAVAFSGGVDSSVLLHAAHAELGARSAGVIADSASLPRRELSEARETARSIGARLVELATDELADERYRSNRGDRCYFCKAALFRGMAELARREGFRFLAFGEITDDLADDRPGARAALEHEVAAPLREAGFDKADVRRYAREHGLPSAEKPASACLASRLPVGTRVTRARLLRVEQAEEAARAFGFRQLRVRDHGRTARMEVAPDELERAEGLRPGLVAALAGLGFEALELAAYRAPAERVRSGAPGAAPSS